MSIFKRGKTYWYEFRFNGVRVRESAKTTSKRLAEQIEAARKTQLAKHEVGIDQQEPLEAPRFRTYAQQVIERLKAKSKRASTVAFYEAKLKNLLEFSPLADASLDKINKRLIDEYIVYSRRLKPKRVQSGKKMVVRHYRVSPSTVNRELATLRMILFQAREDELVDGVPKIRMLEGERPREFVLTPAQEPVYFAAVPQPLHDIALLLLDTGLRIGEALQLQWSDIHLDKGPRAKFGYVQVKRGKSKNASRTVPLTPRSGTMLTLRKMAATSVWVFANEAGEGPWLGTSLNHQHQKVRSILKLPKEFVLHSLRHTMLTRLGLAGADVFTIKKIAGHSSVKVSERYVHPSSESNERAIERMLAQYKHLNENHARVDEEVILEANSAESPHKSPHSGSLVKTGDASKSLQ